MDSASASGAVFVTVGTTRFDDLVKEVLTPSVQKELHRKGYSRMIVQYGNSEVEWPDEKGKLQAEQGCMTPPEAGRLLPPAREIHATFHLQITVLCR